MWQARLSEARFAAWIQARSHCVCSTRMLARVDATSHMLHYCSVECNVIRSLFMCVVDPVHSDLFCNCNSDISAQSNLNVHLELVDQFVLVSTRFSDLLS